MPWAVLLHSENFKDEDLEMINTTIKYIVYTHTGGGVRHHNFGTQNNIINEADGHASAGDVINALGFPTLPFNGDTLPFAFMSVHGAADGNHLYTSPGNQTVQVGSTDIDILVVYAPPGGIGGPNGGPGVWIDAFNVDTGHFSDSLNFVTILTPPTPPDTVDAAMTTFVNQDGTVSTVNAENVRAQGHVDGVPFVEWKRITGASVINSAPEIDFAQGRTGEIWFAFYQSTPPPNVSLPNLKQMMEAGIFLLIGDGTCGNGGRWIGPGHGPVGPGPGTIKVTLSKDIIAKLNPDQQKQLKGIMDAYPAQAQAALVAMTNVINDIGQINSIVSKAQR